MACDVNCVGAAIKWHSRIYIINMPYVYSPKIIQIEATSATGTRSYASRSTRQTPRQDDSTYPPTHTHQHTPTHACTSNHAHTHPLTATRAHTHNCPHQRMHAHTHTHPCMHAYPPTHTYPHPHMHKKAHPRPLPPTCMHTLPRTHTHTNEKKVQLMSKTNGHLRFIPLILF